MVGEIDQPLGALYSLFASVEESGLQQRSVVRVLDIRFDRSAASRLGLPEFAPLLYLERLRFAGNEPLALDRVWLPAAGCRALLDADFTRTALYDELASRCGIRLTGGHEHIRAVVATEAEAALLELPSGTAAFSIERLGRRDGEPLEWRHTLVRGDRFTVSADFAADAGYRLELAADHLHEDMHAGQRSTEVSAAQAAHLIEAGAVMVDVRDAEAFVASHVPNSTSHPVESFEVGEFVGSPPVIVVSASGKLSQQVAADLRAAGIDALNLTGGMDAWLAAGLPLTS